MCNEAVKIEPSLLVFVSGCFKAQEMCNEVVHNWPWPSPIPDHLRTQKTCNKIMQAIPKWFIWISECFKKQGMC